jgi:hypothetical protein
MKTGCLKERCKKKYNVIFVTMDVFAHADEVIQNQYLLLGLTLREVRAVRNAHSLQPRTRRENFGVESRLNHDA